MTTEGKSQAVSKKSVLKVRLLDGQVVVEEFSELATLDDVALALNKKHKLPGTYQFRQNYPNVLYTPKDHKKTLQDLGFVPNGYLAITTAANEEYSSKPNTTVSNPKENQAGFFATWLNILLSFIRWFLGYNVNTNTNTVSAESLDTATRGTVNHVHSEKDYDACKNTSDLVVVDFSAVWCGPCKRIAPYFEELARKNTSVVFVHVDIDELKHLPDRQDIQVVPTFKFFKGKKLVSSITGVDGSKLLETINRYK